MKLKGLLFLLLLFFSVNGFSQNSKEDAYQIALKAIQLMDQGELDESINLLNESIKLDPDRFDYPYELAYAYYLKKEYKEVVSILEQTKNHPNVTIVLFQLLGNSYDLLGERENAFKVYDEGLVKFPNSGIMYLEKGNVHLNKEEYNEALSYYEKGIELDPSFSSNYYRAAKLYCSSTEELWGMIYGEIFMNLERNSARTAEISKLLFDTYKSEIQFTSDSSFTVSFSKNAVIDVRKKKPELPFAIGVYEPTLMMEVIGHNDINIHTLNDIRTGFVINYFKNKRDKRFPNVLFDYQNKLLKEGHLEAYNYWILMKGQEDEFIKWKDANNQKWNDFVNWFNPNGLTLDKDNHFYKGQYDN